MVNLTEKERVNPLQFCTISNRFISISPAQPMARISLRARQKDAIVIGKALGITLPSTPKTSSQVSKKSKLTRTALWLGPDEWQVFGPEKTDFFNDLKKVDVLHSATDISHRNSALIVEGPKVFDVLMAACPQDLSDAIFPVGACSRTVYAKAEVIIWRIGEQSYHVECWRSFSDYVFKIMARAAKNL